MPLKYEYSLRQYLMAFGAALLLPILGLATISLWEFARAEKQQNEQRAEAVAQQIIADVDQELARLQAAGQALASSAALRAGNYERFQQRATEVTKALPRSDYEIVVRDLTGQQVVNTHVPWGTPLPKGVLAEVDRQVIETKRPYVSDLFTGATAKRPLLNIRIPVLADETVTHVLSIAFEPAHLTELLRKYKLPPEWTPTVLDRTNRVIASLMPDRLVGATLSQAGGVPGDGLWWGLNAQGDRVLRAFAGSDLSGWRAFIEVPVHVIQAPLWRTLWLFGALVAALLVISVTLALWFGHRIARPFQRLAEDARALGHGGAQLLPLASGVKEADQVSRAMAAAYTELTHREAALAASFREVAERDRQAVELRAGKEIAEQSSKAKSDFLATMSHELRTPLNGIIGFTNLLLEAGLDEQQRMHFTKLARDAGQSLLVIVNDILDFSKIEAGKLDLTHQSLEVHHLAVSCVRLMEHAAAEKGLKLSCELAPDLPAWVTGDKQRLQQVLLNLLNNAVKFTERGCITLAVSRTAGNGRGPSWFHFSVTDTGIGIPQDKLGLVFERFSQLDSSKTRQFGGTGLGLPISERLVELMGGSIGVASTPGEGSRFWFDVPLPETTAPARIGERSPVPITERESRPARVLLAEDLKMNQILVTAILKRGGHQVDVAENGEVAVEAVQREDYDLVLMDVQMPVMDGLEATRRIRALTGKVANIPVVALTASVLERDVEACRAAGMDDFVAKPVDADALLRAVERWARPKPVASATQPREAPTQPMVLDKEYLGTIEGLVGRGELQTLVGSFLSDLGQRLAVITAPGTECGTMEREAHALVSQAGILGLVELSSCSRKLTDACRSAEEGDILKRVQELIEAAERARAHLPERDTSAAHDEPV